MLFRIKFRISPLEKNCFIRNVHYIQGQSPSSKSREYFYFIDHQGQLFLDDAKMKNFTSCFKEKAFLQFFFTRLRLNDTGRYTQDFPYFSPCGRESNYIRCDDRPVVYTHIVRYPDSAGTGQILYGYAGDTLSVPFQPEKVCMLPETGRVYHPASPSVGGVGLIKSKLAIELSKYFEFGDGEDKPPTQFLWAGKKYALTNELIPLMNLSPFEARKRLEVKS
ncbi:hypothetical protein CHS0354_003551 [Potamilus streckersoni]|uniref:Uncharacterized protein n=1 Tax=Potamilus streckersoni TaxID=2493646 RepID=A0AAE0RVF2_9BIVA|nr:hypothetical protein CHS0354_003551 [Potamilus streckersoni]